MHHYKAFFMSHSINMKSKNKITIYSLYIIYNFRGSFEMLLLCVHNCKAIISRGVLRYSSGAGIVVNGFA